MLYIDNLYKKLVFVFYVESIFNTYNIVIKKKQ